MPADFNDDSKEQVRQLTDIVDLTGQSIHLLKRGRIYVGLCPWHDDERPSMQVDPQRQTWKCWVCDIGGDIFSFVMQREGVDFRAALEILAETAGVQLSGPRRDDIMPGSAMIKRPSMPLPLGLRTSFTVTSYIMPTRKSLETILHNVVSLKRVSQRTKSVLRQIAGTSWLTKYPTLPIPLKYSKRLPCSGTVRIGIATTIFSGDECFSRFTIPKIALSRLGGAYYLNSLMTALQNTSIHLRRSYFQKANSSTALIFRSMRYAREVRLS